ncbi:unnamed protein product [Ranitomeya imitator]|uniref:GIY-YIG domain-containing protein n=1 Tax=Ranitomeya imitator TaxID=111125 RepID=A0ABN9LTR1_9NEOB|nr:unnamed protein product [Ranitomeya imitator]
MGSNVAPPFANIFMDFYETSYVYCHPLFSSNTFYDDDVFFIWTGDAEALRGFHADLNSSTPNITFSLQYSDQSINFLDTLVIIRSGGIVETDLYVKSTDRNSLLSYSSNHPRHVKKALPKSQHDRIRRIVSNPVQRTMRHMEMDRKFHDRGYPPTLDGNIGAQNINVTATPKQPRIAMVSVFHPFTQQIQQCILKHWNILQNSYPTIPEFNTRPIFCDKRSDNLRNYLVRADIGSSRPSIKQRVLSTPRNGTFPCLGCLQCSNVTKGDSFTHPRSGHRFPIKGHFTFDSSFAIYLIKCPCGLGYVGETTQHIRDRISQHKSTIRCGRTLLPVPAHFSQNNHTVAQLKYQIIDWIPPMRRGGNRIEKLKIRESYWIHKLQTLFPLGLNREYEGDRAGIFCSVSCLVDVYESESEPESEPDKIQKSESESQLWLTDSTALV